MTLGEGLFAAFEVDGRGVAGGQSSQGDLQADVFAAWVAPFGQPIGVHQARPVRFGPIENLLQEWIAGWRHSDILRTTNSRDLGVAHVGRSGCVVGAASRAAPADSPPRLGTPNHD